MVHRMRVLVLCPSPPGSRSGNRVTALRWVRILRSLGHRVSIRMDYRVGAPDLLVALHARKSAGGIRRYQDRNPGRPVLLALTGTDLYHDFKASRVARETAGAVTRLIALHPLAVRDLPARLRGKTSIITQSARPTPGVRRRIPDRFQVCVVGHLREVKDPKRAAFAVRNLPSPSRIRILHAGRALTPAMERWARTETRDNPRYGWVGELPPWRVRWLIAGSRLLLLTSRMEGGANVISEAVVDGIPVLSSRISAAEGLLGRDYPGFFPVGSTPHLRRLLLRAENDPSFLADLRNRCRSLRPRFHPRRELATWRALLAEIPIR